ncbi:MAG TPA: hypothetical protein VK604_27730 [Bryobacteraceae bacterium]|nr:hypothetical protein [Bryobacteraceae bacterium]HTF70938.1 hypothetical protein [Edaphobacter sp.]
MKQTMAKMILIATLSATFGVTALKAQEQAIAIVPFAFHVQSQTMPAGRYEVNQLGNAVSMILISDRQGHSRFVGTVPQGQANPADPKLTFACYRGQCSLMTVDLPGSGASHRLQQTHPAISMGLSSMIAIHLTR